MFRRRSALRAPLAASVAAALLTGSLAGCGQPGQVPGPISIASKPALALDPADSCVAQREEFAKSKNYFTDEILTGAANGAVMGAAAGLALTLITHGNVGTGMLAGAGTGALVGGGSAYAKTVQQKSQDQADLARNINTDLTKEGDQIDHTTASFARLRECRFNEARRIKFEVRRHSIKHKDALDQIAYQHDRFMEELALAQQYSITMGKRDEQFKDAASAVRQDQAATAAAAQQAALVKTAATVSIPEKRNSFDKSVKSAESSSKVAFNLDSNAKFSAGRRATTPV